MKIKRFHAGTMRAALQQVREEQGPESVILSKRRVSGGIEVIAAVDYDEALLHQWTQQHASGHNATAGNATDRNGPPPTTHVGAKAYAATGNEPPAHADDPPGAAHATPVAAENRQEPSSTADRSPDFRAIFDAAATISPIQEPSQASVPTPSSGTEAADLDALTAQLEALQNTVNRQFAELRWDDLQRRKPELAEVIRRLDLLGLERPQVRAIVQKLDEGNDQKKVWRNAIGLLAKRIPLVSQDICDEGGIFAVVGPTGAGKTTSLAKLATRFALGHSADQLGMITTDSQRIGAQDHLFRFGKILGVPVQVAASPDILRATLDQLADKHLILIDTAGFSPRNDAEFASLQNLTRYAPAIQTLLTLPANAQTQSLKESIRVFDQLGLDGAIVTKIDEATSLGGLLSAVMEASLNICYITDGQRVPEDIRPAGRYRAGFVSEAVNLAGRFSERRHATDTGSRGEHEETPSHLTTTEERVASYG